MKVWDSEAKEGPLETGSGDKPEMSCHCLLLPWVRVSLGPFKPGIEEAHA